MKFRIILFFILGFLFFNSLTYTHAVPIPGDGDEMPDTTHRKNNADSLREARAHVADSIRDARQHIADSMKTARAHVADSMRISRAHIADSARDARQHHADSLMAARKHIADSSARIRKYRDSKHYKDSVARAHNAKINAMKTARLAHMDSIKNARKEITDSIASARKERTDSIKTVQKHRTDSLAKIKKYKTSKRYADSVTLVKRIHTDSIKAAQKTFRDNIAAIRKHSLDSAKAIRKHTMDSIKVVRTKHLDSIKLVRKAKTDSLAKAKKLKEDIAKSKLKKKEDAMKLKMDLKIKQKHQAWSNTQMLKKRWSPIRRVTQNSFTHYNYYYNAKKKMEEAQVNMQRTRKENYDSLIGLYPFDPNRDSALLSSDMDTIVRKISVGIQIHDPRVKWSNDLYLLLGEAYYYRGQYENAAISFRYIIAKDEEEKKKGAAKSGYHNSKDGPSILEDDEKSGIFDFLKHKSVHNEAILWLARTYTEAHQVENAESILSLLESDKKLPDELKGRLATEKAFAYLASENDAAAAEQLSVTMDDNSLPDWLRMRAAFIRGQLLENMGQYKEAAASFERVLTYYPKLEMDFYSRKYVAFNRLQSGENIEESMKPLKHVLSDGKYVNYYDQVYYVLGKLAMKANDNDKAITYLTKSTTTPKATKKQKALSFAALGDVYYATANYPGAKNAYDSAAKYSKGGGKNTEIATSLQRSKGLEEVSIPSKVIHDQDSLLDLADMSKREQESVVRRYLRDLEKKRLDSITNAENAEVTALVPSEPEESKDNSGWYFGSTTLMQQGSADFKKKWGNRPLTDNWQRASAIAFSNTGSTTDDDDLADATPTDGKMTEESLLARIPNTPQQKEQARKLEQRAYMQLAKAYVKQLEDYDMAIQTMDTLDIRYPNHNQKEEELYLRYQIALKQNKLDKARQYSDELLAKFPKSQYAAGMRPKTSESKGPEMADGKTVNVYFDTTYALLQRHQYTEALMRVNVAKKEFTHPIYKKRFEIIEAMALAGSGEYDLADTMISRFIATNPKDTLTAWAGTVKNYIKEVRNGGKPSWYKEGPYVPSESTVAKTETKKEGPAIPLTKPTPPPPPSDIPSAYTYVPDTDHYCVVVLPGIDSRTAGLKKAVKDLNGAKYPAAGLELLFDMYTIDQGVLIIKKFKNADEAKTYMTSLLASNAMKGYAPGELQVEIISGPNYKKMFADKKAQPYLSFYNSYYR